MQILPMCSFVITLFMVIATYFNFIVFLLCNNHLTYVTAVTDDMYSVFPTSSKQIVINNLFFNVLNHLNVVRPDSTSSPLLYCDEIDFGLLLLFKNFYKHVIHQGYQKHHSTSSSTKQKRRSSSKIKNNKLEQEEENFEMVQRNSNKKKKYDYYNFQDFSSVTSNKIRIRTRYYIPIYKIEYFPMINGFVIFVQKDIATTYLKKKKKTTLPSYNDYYTITLLATTYDHVDFQKLSTFLLSHHSDTILWKGWYLRFHIMQKGIALVNQNQFLPLKSWPLLESSDYIMNEIFRHKKIQAYVEEGSWKAHTFWANPNVIKQFLIENSHERSRGISYLHEVDLRISLIDISGVKKQSIYTTCCFNCSTSMYSYKKTFHSIFFSWATRARSSLQYKPNQIYLNRHESRIAKVQRWLLYKMKLLKKEPKSLELPYKSFQLYEGYCPVYDLPFRLRSEVFTFLASTAKDIRMSIYPLNTNYDDVGKDTSSISSHTHLKHLLIPRHSFIFHQITFNQKHQNEAIVTLRIYKGVRGKKVSVVKLIWNEIPLPKLLQRNNVVLIKTPLKISIPQTTEDLYYFIPIVCNPPIFKIRIQ